MAHRFLGVNVSIPLTPHRHRATVRSMSRALTVRLDDDTDAALKEMAEQDPSKSTADLVREAIASSRSLVYFVRRADGAVKIGFTAALLSRLAGLKTEYGAITLEAIQPGGRAEETAAHKTLAACRLGRSEWFRGPAVEAAIVALVSEHGRPDPAKLPLTELRTAVRLSKPVLAWLERKRAELHAQGLYISLSGVLKQQLDRVRRLDEEPRPKGPKKARTST